MFYSRSCRPDDRKPPMFEFSAHAQTGSCMVQKATPGHAPVGSCHMLPQQTAINAQTSSFKTLLHSAASSMLKSTHPPCLVVASGAR
eukprot:s2447_g8.t1